MNLCRISIFEFRILLSILLIGLIFAFPPYANAQTRGGVEVQPAYIDVDISPDDAQQELVIRYTNHSQHPVTLEVYPIDFRSENPNGGIGFIGQNAGEYSYSLSSFLSFETNRLDLEAGETKALSVVTRNRQDLTPGGHYAAVVARQVQIDASETTVAPAVSTLIFLRKTGGESYNLSLKNMSWPRTLAFSYPPTVTLLFQNEGNTHLTPIGKMEVVDMFGRVIYAGVLNEGFVKVLPESQRYVPIYIKQVAPVLPFSINSLKLTGTDHLKKVTFSRTEVFIYIHPLLGVSLVLLGIGSLFWLRKRRRVDKMEGKVEVKEQPVKVVEKARKRTRKKKGA